MKKLIYVILFVLINLQAAQSVTIKGTIPYTIILTIKNNSLTIDTSYLKNCCIAFISRKNSKNRIIDDKLTIKAINNNDTITLTIEAI